MSNSELIDQTIAEHLQVVADFREQCSSVIQQMAEQTVAALREGNKICFFGNGGSAADAQHFATEFVVRYTRNRRGLPSIAFTTDTSTITACANDFGYDSIFARQVEAQCKPGDIVLGISTSGNSANVVQGLKMAQSMGVTAFAFTGEKPGDCGKVSELVVSVPSPVTARVQECHLIAGHLICDISEEAFADQPSAISSS